MIRMFGAVTLLGAGLALSACGSSSSSGGNTPPPPPPSSSGGGSVSAARVAGPLDPVQEQVSTNVFGPLADAAAGSPLEGVIRCADETITYNVLDIGDTVLAQLQATLLTGGSVPLDPDPAALTASMGSLAANLTQLLEALAGSGEGCTASTVSLDRIQSGVNPLAGTPLAPLGAELGPVLSQIAGLVNNSNNSGDDLQLASVASLVTQLNIALQNGLAQIPESAYEAPVVGATLTTLATAVHDTANLLGAVLVYDSVGTGQQFQNLLENTLVNLLTGVLPVRDLEAQAGQPGVISSQIEGSVAQLSALLGQVIGTVSTPVLSNLLGGAMSPVLDPIENELLPTLLGPLGDALAGIGNGSSANPLAPVLIVFENVLGTLVGGLGGGVGGIGGGSGGGSSGGCAFANLPLLSGLCNLPG